MKETSSPIASIIIPVYNVEGYISHCLESLFHGVKEDDFEVIVVNDGSKDHSLEEVERFQSSHKNLRILSQENQGVAAARNNGLLHAEGKYILFLDGDDYYEQGALMKVLHELQECESEIVVFEMKYSQKEELLFPWRGKMEEGKLYKGTDLYRMAYGNGSVCGSAFRREFLKENSITFPLGLKNAEDTIFFLQCQKHSDKIEFKGITLYRVVERAGSASRIYSKEKLNDFKAALDYIERMILQERASLTPLQCSMLNYTLYRIISSATLYATRDRKSGLGALTEYGFQKVLPIDTTLIPKQLLKEVKLLNCSFGLYYILKSLKYRLQKR